MIIFLEGLPRSGKSHAFVKDHLIPAIQKGRKVFTNVAGINHDKISAVSGIPLDQVKELVIQLTDEQVPQWWKHVENDALVGLDELQDFWPVKGQQMNQDATKAVTQHGHRGLDVVAMGQSLKDVNAIWRRRVDRKYIFVKKDVLGKDDQYQWSCYKATSADKFEQISKGDGKYDPLICECYKSHEEGTENKEVYADDKAVIWKNPVFRKWLPLYVAVFLFALYWVWHAFHGGLVEDKKPPAKSPPVAQATALIPAAQVGSAQPVATTPSRSATPLPEATEPADIIEVMSKAYKIRLLGYFRVGNKTNGFIEWRGNDNLLIDRRTFDDLSGLGWVVYVNGQATVAQLVKGPVKLIATSWPIIDSNVRATQDRIERVRLDGLQDLAKESAPPARTVQGGAPPGSVPFP